MAASPSDLADALAFLGAHPCRLVEADRIQLPPGLPADQVARARCLKPALLELLNEAHLAAAVERAGILEYEAGFSRTDAEHMARLSGLSIMLNTPGAQPCHGSPR